ncbi:hypothetical protein RRG08_004931 [Elysia crispata]|uniref:Uncharacterized protein n=1 Tax=Elysia crispata TaxID=231223 RepID=A0AAE1DGC8_9GAST|nr:hypothetical protein RRG08_004931 [Elysia crispata]
MDYPILILLATVSALSTAPPVTAQTYNQTADLMRNLFNGYDKNIRPLLNQNDTLNILVDIKLRAVENVNEKDQIITLSVVLVLFWVDEMLAWDPRDYGNLTVINPGTDMLWLPPLNLWGQISENQLLVDTSFVVPLHVSHTGLVSWYTRVRFVQMCKMDMTYFPNDEHRCLFEIYIHTYYVHQVKMQLTSPTISDKNYIENIEYECIPSLMQSQEYGYDSNGFQVLLIPLTIRRYPHYFVVNLLFPTLALSFLNILVFVLPADSGEKVGYSITVLLSVMLIMGVTTDNMPASSQLPLITQFLAILIAISVLSVVATVMSLVIHHRDETEQAKRTKILSILRHWKKAVADKFFKSSKTIQVRPSDQSSRKIRPETSSPPTPAGSTISTASSLRQRDAENGQELKNVDSVLHQNSFGDFGDRMEFPAKTQTTGRSSNVRDAPTFWRAVAADSVLSKMQPLPPDRAAAADATFRESRARADGTFTQVKNNLDMIFFWIFLAAWLSSTLGYLVAIFA